MSKHEVDLAVLALLEQDVPPPPAPPDPDQVDFGDEDEYEGPLTIDVGPPSWVSAVEIFMMVLRNPQAGADAVQSAREEITRLAQWADRVNAEEGQ